MTEPHDEGDWGGPYVANAFLCEAILEEKDNLFSFIRVLDRITFSVNATLGDVPNAMPPLPYQCHLALSFKTGRAKGRHDVTIRMERPSGLHGPEQTYPLFFEGEDRGNALNIQLNLLIEGEGLYWFDVLIDRRLMTRIPMRVIYLPVGMSRS